MMYLYLGKNTVKVLGLTKSLLGQYNIAHFTKTHSSDFLVEGKLQGSDLIASAVKEAVTQAQPEAITEKDMCLILPQEIFTFGRYTVPADISDSAIIPFIQDKVRTDLKISLEDTYHDYIVNTKDGQSTVFFYALPKEVFDSLKETFGLVQLRIAKIIPETVAYYTLFEKTLRKDKKENIMYAVYKEQNSFAYLFDTHGLLKNEKFYLDTDIKPGLKALVTKFEADGSKINRLILSGSQSPTVRQDLFTKDVGAWTNPLEKIVDNFYKDYLKMIVPNENQKLSMVQYDVCFGSFIFTEEHKDFTLMQQTISGSKSRKLPKVSLNFGIFSEIFRVKTLVMFAISFAISFGIIFGWSKISGGELNLSLPSLPKKEAPAEPTPSAEPTEVPTPTPSIERSELKVKVLNGGGTPGKAGEVKTILQDAGYSDIVTANADSFDYETTEVQLSEDAEDALSFIQEDLADYVTISDAATIDDEDETADVIIIIGSDFQ